MQCNKKRCLPRMAAFSVAAFVLCFALAGATDIAAAFSDKKAYSKGHKALRKGDYLEAEKIFRDLLNKDAQDVEARLGLSFALLKQRSLQGAYDNAARVIWSAGIPTSFPMLCNSASVMPSAAWVACSACPDVARSKICATSSSVKRRSVIRDSVW